MNHNIFTQIISKNRQLYQNDLIEYKTSIDILLSLLDHYMDEFEFLELLVKDNTCECEKILIQHLERNYIVENEWNLYHLEKYYTEKSGFDLEYFANTLERDYVRFTNKYGRFHPTYYVTIETLLYRIHRILGDKFFTIEDVRNLYRDREDFFYF